MSSTRHYTLTISCPDRAGIIAAVSGFIAQHGGFIVEASYHTEQEAQRFFMRQEIRADSLPFDAEEFRRRFSALADEFEHELAAGRFRHQETPGDAGKQAGSLPGRPAAPLAQRRVAGGHSLRDLQPRRSAQLRRMARHPVHPCGHAADKDAAFDQIAALFEQHRGDSMVLARFMQILPPSLCRRFPGRIINIHHSFLPSFVGAKPYHQAYLRGVKLIGATCHYVTDELDAGPIIEQDTVRIDHGDTVDDLVRYGRDIEKTVLSRGLRYHVEDRVLVCGNKTIVFR